MKKKQIIILLFCLFGLSVNAQIKTSEKDSLEIAKVEKLLIGEWNFIKTVDKKNNEIKYVIKDYKDPFGEEIKIVANGPELKLNENHTYLMKFTEINSDIGNWKLLSKNKIIYKMVIKKNSKDGEMLTETQNVLEAKWDLDKDGNYINNSTDEIISINETELRIKYEKKYILIYKKKKNIR